MFIKIDQDMEIGEETYPAGSVLEIHMEDGYFSLEELSMTESYWRMEFRD